MQDYIITIARQYGSGGKTIGKMLSERMHIPYYDREIISMASEDSGINAVLFSDERLRPDLAHLLRSRYTAGKPISAESAGFTKDDNLFRYQAKIIQQLANEGPCIIIGRCADYILRARRDIVRVFVTASPDFCLQEAKKVDSLPERDVLKKIEATDRYRAKYYKYYTKQEWNDARNYDLCLNSAKLGFDGVCDAILAYLELRTKYAL